MVQQAENPYAFGSPGYSAEGNALLQAYAGTHSGAYQYAVYYGVGNTTGRVRRPVVVVDGIDVGFNFGNGRSADEIFNTLLNRTGVVVDNNPPVDVRLGDDVLADGYDIVILDYGDALDFIERNALSLVHLLTRLNAQLGPGERVQAVVGPSLGALVARYALAYMETNGIAHNVPLYVSFDGAHQGGHIPVGIQQLADDITHHTDFGQFYPSGFTAQVDAVFQSPAVRELLVFNAFAADYTQSPGHAYFRQDPLRVGLINGMIALGDYPVGPRKVAIVNGSPNGLSQLDGDGTAGRVAPGDVQLVLDAYWTYGIGGFRTLMEAFAAPATSGTIYRRREFTCNIFCQPNGIPVNPSPYSPAPWVTSATGPLDSAPGGWRDTGRSLAVPFGTVYTWADAVDRLQTFDLGALVEPALYFARQLLSNGDVVLSLNAPTPNHSFVSTLSALDYNTTAGSRQSLLTSTFAGQDLYRNVLADVQAGTAAPRTPFNGYYLAGDNGAESRENQEHIALTPGIATYVRAEIASVAVTDRVYTTSTSVPGDALQAGATVTLGDNVAVTYTGAVTAAPGVTFRLGRGARVQFLSTATVVGTAVLPVRFIRANAAAAWDRVAVVGDGSRFEHAHFVGGTKSIDVTARGVVVRHAQFRDGWRGVSTYYTPSGARSEVRLESVLVEGSTSVGVVLDHVDATLTQSVVRSSAEAGLWVRDARVRVTSSTVEANGTTQSSRDGVEVYAGGEVLLDNYAYNTVRTNGRYELAAFSGARLYAGTRICRSEPAATEARGSSPADLWCQGGGYNTIADARGGGLVYNGSVYTVPAQMNYWGEAPGAARFYGPVTYNPFLSASPTGPLAPATPEGRSSERPLAGSLSSMPDQAAELLRLHRLEPEATAAAWAVAVGPIERAAAGGDERAALVLVSQAAAVGDHSRARALAQQFDDVITSLEGRAELAVAQITLLEQEGRYAEALRTLEAARPLLAEGLYTTLQPSIEDHLSSASALAESRQDRETLSGSPIDGDGEVEVGSVYPNPTLGMAQVPITLLSDAHCVVEVFAADGRRVTSRPAVWLGPGHHVVQLPTHGLSAGLYVVRVHVAGAGVSDVSSRRFVVLD